MTFSATFGAGPWQRQETKLDGPHLVICPTQGISVFLCTVIKVRYRLIYTAHFSQMCPADPQRVYFHNHWKAGIFGAEARWWKCCREGRGRGGRERERTPKTQNFTAFHSASCSVRSISRRCWHLTTRSVEAPCLPPQIPRLPRAIPQFGIKTSQVRVAKEFWSSWISSAQRSFKSLFLNTHYPWTNLMPTMRTTLLEHQVRSHLSRNAMGGIRRE